MLVVPALGYAVPLQNPDSGTPVRIALIQGNVPRVGFGREEQEAAVLDNHVKETEVLAADIRSGKAVKPDLVVWPENGSDMDPYSDPGVAAQIRQAVDDVGVPVLVGAVINANTAGTNVLNRLIVWTPGPGGGMGATYDKTHLVPFGEYLPFRDILTKAIKRSTCPARLRPRSRQGRADPQRGHRRRRHLLRGRLRRRGPQRRQGRRPGPAGPQQQRLLHGHRPDLPAAGDRPPPRRRARPLDDGGRDLRCVAVIDPHGRILAQTGEYQARYLDMQVRRNTGLTLADRVGAWPEYVFALLGLLAAIGLGGAATTCRRTRSLIPAFRTGAGTLPGAPDGDRAPSGPDDDADLQTAAKG